MKILVAEDHPLLGKSIKRALTENDWTVDLAVDGAEALYYAESGKYDVIVLDWMLPKISGIDLITKLRLKGDNTPIIMTTARNTVADRIVGLTNGADDYLVKPFDIAELLARIQALYRRATHHGSNVISVGELTLDAMAHCISLHNVGLELTGKEYDLLSTLMGKAGSLIYRNDLVSLLYSVEDEPGSNSLDVILNRVRKKLAASNVIIETIRGKGFILRVAPTLN